MSRHSATHEHEATSRVVGVSAQVVPSPSPSVCGSARHEQSAHEATSRVVVVSAQVAPPSPSVRSGSARHEQSAHEATSRVVGAGEHVSVFELHQFVTRAESSREFDAHVSNCSSCAKRLSHFARREVAPVAVLEEEPRRLAAFVMAFAACFAVMLVQAIRVPKFDAPPPSPEGVHGVSRSDDPRLIESMVFSAGASVDSGAIDSGVR